MLNSEHPPSLNHERFEVLERLGTGGFGTVFKVHDRDAGQNVALKLLRGQSPVALLNFKNEFRGLADIHHPNLVTLFELHQHHDAWFFTMEHVEGESFDEHIDSACRDAFTTAFHGQGERTACRNPLDDSIYATAEQGPPTLDTQDSAIIEPAERGTILLDPQRLRDVFFQLATGLSFLHRRGILHCDIKPSNVIVENGGRVVLLDFGLSRRLQMLPGEEDATSEHLIGTPPFMAPEVCAGRAPVPASDWYSFGVMLYHALTNRLPFSGSPVDIMMAKQTQRVVPASQLVEGIPEELDALCSALLERDILARPSVETLFEVLGGAQQIHAVSSSSLPAVSAVGAPEQVFVGRAAELDALHQLYREDVGGVAIVEGPSGYGKTALTEAFCESVPRGTWLLRSRCYEHSAVAYEAFDGAMDHLRLHLQRLSEGKRRALYPEGMWALARVFRVFSDIVDEPAPEGAAGWDTHRVRRIAYAALRELLQRASQERRVVLLIDDLQWIDEDSIALLSELLRPHDAPALRVMCVASCRDEVDSNATLRSALDELRQSPHVLTVHVGPLDDASARELATQLTGQAAETSLIDALVQSAEGNPLFLEGLATDRAEGEEACPETSLARVIMRRVEYLSEPARQALTVLSVAGQPVPRGLLAQAVQADVVVGLEEITRLRQLRLLRSVAGEQLAPYHDRVREAIVAHLAPETGRATHLAIAEAAERTGCGPGFISTHYNAAGDAHRALPFTLRAAEAAAEALAFDRAASLYREALALGDPQGELHHKLGDALRNAGHGPDAAAAYLRAAELSTSLDTVEHLKSAAVEQLLFSGSFDAGESVIREVLGELGLSVATHELAAFSAFALQGAKLKLRGFRYQLRPSEHVSRATLRELDILWSATIGLSMVQPIASQAILKRYLYKALDAGERSHLVRAIGIELAFSGLQGGSNERFSVQTAQRAEALLTHVDDAYLRAFIAMAKGAIHWLRGRWTACEDVVLPGIPAIEKMPGGVTWELDTSWFMVLSARLHMGRLLELRRTLPAFLADGEERGDLYFETQLRTRFSPLIALCDDRPEDAIRELEVAIRRWTSTGYHVVHYWAYHSHIEALLYAGRASDALEQLRSGSWKLKRSLLLIGEYYRVLFLYLKLRVELAAALELGVATRPGARLLKSASRLANRLCRGALPWIPPHGDLGHGLIAWARGRNAGAIARLNRAAAGFAAANMELHHHVALRRLAQIERNAETVAIQDAWMREQRIAHPENLCQMLAPCGSRG